MRSSAVIRYIYVHYNEHIYLCAIHLLYLIDTSKNISWVKCQFIIYISGKDYIYMSKDM